MVSAVGVQKAGRRPPGFTRGGSSPLVIDFGRTTGAWVGT